MAECWADGTDNFQNKTPPKNSERRNKESCATHGRIAGIPLIVKPIVVPVPLAVVIPVEVKNVAVTVRVAKNCIKYLLCHCPLNTL